MGGVRGPGTCQSEGSLLHHQEPFYVNLKKIHMYFFEGNVVFPMMFKVYKTLIYRENKNLSHLLIQNAVLGGVALTSNESNWRVTLTPQV